MFHYEDIRYLRDRLGWDRRGLASYLGVSEAEVTAWEEGRSQPTTDQLGVLYRLADRFDVPFDPFRRGQAPVISRQAPFEKGRLQKVQSLVEKHYAEPIRLQQAAAVACLEKKYFSKFFRRQVGLGFSQWLAHFRLQKAIQLLSTSDTGISDIAYTVGFQSIRTFERSFKRLTGMSPGEYRKKRRVMT